MKLYSATVRLAGSLSNEVSKSQITAAEIAVLQRIHGEDAVQKISEIGEVKGRSDARERARLAVEYPKGLGADGKQPLEGVAFINSIFGVGTPLPHVYVEREIDETAEEIALEPEGQEEIELAEKPEPIKRTRLAPKEKKAAESAELMA